MAWRPFQKRFYQYQYQKYYRKAPSIRDQLSESSIYRNVESTFFLPFCVYVFGLCTVLKVIRVMIQGWHMYRFAVFSQLLAWLFLNYKNFFLYYTNIHFYFGLQIHQSYSPPCIILPFFMSYFYYL